MVSQTTCINTNTHFISANPVHHATHLRAARFELKCLSAKSKKISLIREHERTQILTRTTTRQSGFELFHLVNHVHQALLAR